MDWNITKLLRDPLARRKQKIKVGEIVYRIKSELLTGLSTYLHHHLKQTKRKLQVLGIILFEDLLSYDWWLWGYVNWCWNFSLAIHFCNAVLLGHLYSLFIFKLFPFSFHFRGFWGTMISRAKRTKMNSTRMDRVELQCLLYSSRRNCLRGQNRALAVGDG